MEETAEEQTVRKECIEKITALKEKLAPLKESSAPTGVRAAAEAKGLSSVGTKFKERRKLDCLGKVADVAWNPDGKLLATATQDGKVIVWNAFTKNKEHFIAQSSWFLSCDFSPDGKLLAVAGLDNLCTVHPMPEPGSGDEDPKPVAILEKHMGYIGCNKFLSQTEMVTSSGDKQIIVWDIKKKEALQTLIGHYGDACNVAVCAGETNTFLSASSDGTAKLWDRRAGGNSCVMTYQGHTGGVNKVCYLPNKHSFATLGEDATARLWDIRSHKQINIFTDEENKEASNPGLALDCSKSGRMLFCGYTEGVVLCWDTLTGQMVQEMANHGDAVTGVSVSPDGKAVACCSRDSFCSIWA